MDNSGIYALTSNFYLNVSMAYLGCPGNSKYGFGPTPINTEAEVLCPEGEYGSYRRWCGTDAAGFPNEGWVIDTCEPISNAQTKKKTVFLILKDKKFCVIFIFVILLPWAWEEWTAWTDCSVSCGEGTRAKSRTCNVEDPVLVEIYCSGDNERVEECPNQDLCCKAHIIFFNPEKKFFKFSNS